MTGPQLHARRTPTLRRFADGADTPERRATWLELFFDLVFVIAIAELARLLHHDHGLSGFVTFAGLFIPIWWTWMGFSFYADQFDDDDGPYRVAFLAAMLGVAALAMNLRNAPGGGRGFIIAYGTLQLLLVGLYLRAWALDPPSRHLSGHFAAGNALGASIWFTSLLAPPSMRYALWGVALMLAMVTPLISWRARGAEHVSHAGHTAERFGLFTIIVLGEAVVAVAAGAAETIWAPEPALAAALGFVVAACLWWIYFGFADVASYQAALGRGLLPPFLYGYSHLPLFIGLTAVGVGVRLTVEGATSGFSPWSMRAALCGGIAITLAAVTAMQMVIRQARRGALITCFVTLVALTALALKGGAMAPPALSGSLAVLLVAVIVVESRQSARVAATGPVGSPFDTAPETN